MKKCLAVLLAIVLTLSFFTFTVSADEMEATPYAVACSACRNRMQTVIHNIKGGYFRVLSCSAFNWEHLHYEKYTQTNWICTTDDCPAYGAEIPAGDPVYIGEACGLAE